LDDLLKKLLTHEIHLKEDEEAHTKREVAFKTPTEYSFEDESSEG